LTLGPHAWQASPLRALTPAPSQCLPSTVPTPRAPLPLALLALVAIACADTTAVPSSITGNWGGDHAGLVATPDSGTLEYDCAAGRITEPVRPYRDGTFVVSGTHSPGHGGPIRIDEVVPKRPARYTGHVAGDHLTLTVVMTDSNVTVGTFDLYAGRNPRVLKCL
jgi:hypothetical protein